MKPGKLDPNKMKSGDLFRGKYWRYAENHIFKEYDKELYSVSTRYKGRVISLCNRWFDPNFIHEPKEDTPNNLCYWCELAKQKRNDHETTD